MIQRLWFERRLPFRRGTKETPPIIPVFAGVGKTGLFPTDLLDRIRDFNRAAAHVNHVELRKAAKLVRKLINHK
ncbi:MAG: hypothetical protein D6681_11890 [Calditrichaeota bacterium]|nr:MAG: hypothetical protein D6681_11890 [Calditrichota bacterium]